MTFLTDERTIFSARNDKHAPILDQRPAEAIRAERLRQEERTLAHLRGKVEEVKAFPSRVAYYSGHIERVEKRIADLKGQQ